MFSFDGIKVVSFFPGRVRLRIDRIKEDPGFAERVQTELQHLAGIKKLEVKTSTSSVLVVYDKKALKQADASQALMSALEDLFPDVDSERIKKLLGV